MKATGKLLSASLAAVMVLTSINIPLSRTAQASYTAQDNVYTWVLTDLTDEISYDETEFQGGAAYEYNGISINGASGATITEDGVSFGKVQGSISYIPEYDGTLDVTAYLGANAEVYVDRKVSQKENCVMKPESDGIYSGEIQLSAGTNYHIYNGSSKVVRLRELKFTAAADSTEEPTKTPSPEPTEIETERPTEETTAEPTIIPTVLPTEIPTETAAPSPTAIPTETAAPSPTAVPSAQPTAESTPAATETASDADYTWDITKVCEKSDFDADAFAAGGEYDYDGLIIKGASSAKLTEKGLYVPKVSGYIFYKPESYGTLTVTAYAEAKAEIYVDKGSAIDKKNKVIAPTENGTYTAETELEPGNEYYIYNGSSKVIYIEKIEFKIDNAKVTPTADPVVTEEPTAEPIDVAKPTKKPTEAQRLNAVSFSSDTVTIDNNSTYPISPTNTENKYALISGMDTSAAGTHFTFDMRLNTVVKTDTQNDSAKAYDGFSLEFTNAKSKGGGVLTASDIIEIDGEQAVAFKWRAGAVTWSMPEGTGLKIGHAYTLDFKCNEPTTNGNSKTYTLNLDIYDENGDLYVSAENLSCRAASGYISMVLLEAEMSGAAEKDSVKFFDIYTYLEAPTETVLKSESINDGERLKTDETYEITANKFTDTTVEFEEPYSIAWPNTVPSYITTKMRFSADGADSLPDGITVSGNTIYIGSGTAAGEYDVTAEVSAVYDKSTVLSPTYKFKVKKLAVTPDEIMNEYVPDITSDGKSVSDNDTVYDDLTLPSSNSLMNISWSSSDGSVISETGILSRPLDDTAVTLTAVITSTEDPSKSKTYSITLNAAGVRTMLADALAVAKNGIVSADDATKVMDSEKLADLHEDLKFVTEYKNTEYVGYEKVTYSYVSSGDELKISGDEAQIYPTEVKKYNLTLTISARYGEAEITESVPVTVYLTPENAAAKYAVRCDDNAEVNFEDIASYASSTVSSDLTLPTTGIFGSVISWNSSVPMYMSNTGKYTQPTYNTSVTLTGVVASGDVTSQQKHTYTMTLKGKKSSGSVTSGGGGGGGGGSSSGGTVVVSTPVKTNQTTSSQNPTATVAPDSSENPSAKFEDLDEAEWAREAIETLADKGIVSGRTDETFAPNDDVTRAEFAKIVVNAFGFAASETDWVSVFSDVDEDAWYAQYVAAAYLNGIINGYDDGRFGADDKITRQDMAAIIWRAMQASDMTPLVTEEEMDFADKDEIADYASEAVETLKNAGIINGMTDTEFAPLNNATRAQTAKIIYEVIERYRYEVVRI